MKNTLMARLSGFDWRYLRSSGVITVGLAFARFLGLAFSLVMARLLDPDGYGYIQHGIALAGVFAIVTQPFGQHVLAKIIGKYRERDEDAYNTYMEHAWLLLAVLSLVSLVVMTAILLLTRQFDVGIVAVFIGITVFYTYYGVARGFVDNQRLLAAYLGSNAVQIVAIIVIYVFLGTTEPLAALIVYGASYFLPLALLTVFYPFPLQVKLPRPQWPVIIDLIKMTTPIVISHIGFIVYMSLDLLLLETHVDETALGVYALAKTVANVFIMISMGVTTVILPQIAAAAPGQERRRLLRDALTWHLGLSLAILIVYAFTYNDVVSRVFGAEYVVSTSVYLVIAVGIILSQTHTLISQALVGADKSTLYAASQVVSVIVTFAVGLIAIPALKAEGAALTVFAGAAAAMFVYGVIAASRLVKHMGWIRIHAVETSAARE